MSALAVRGSILDVFRAFITGEEPPEEAWHGIKYAPGAVAVLGGGVVGGALVR